MAKTYFWLKIQEEFYRQKEIKILRQMEKGATYIIIYQKMLIYSLKNGNKLFYDHLKDSFEEEIGLILDEEVEDVKTTVAFLKRAGLLECVSEDEYVLTQVEELTGSENESTKRVKKHRENKKKAEEEKGAKREDKKDIEDKASEREDKKAVEDKVAKKEDKKFTEDEVGRDECRDKRDTKEKVSEKKSDEKKVEEKHISKDEAFKKKCDDKVDNKNESRSEAGCNKNETESNENVTLDIEKDLDKELESDKDIDKKIGFQKDKSFAKDIGDKNHGCISMSVDENLSKITSLYEKNMGTVYPANREYFLDISKKFHWTLFKKAIEICIDKNNMTPAYLKGIIKKWDELKIYTLENLQDKEMEYANKNKEKVNDLSKNNKKSSGEFSKYEGDKYSKYSVENKMKNHNQSEKIDEDMVKEMEALERKLGVS